MPLQDMSTPLFVAVQCNHIEVVEYLIKKGADPRATMTDGLSGSAVKVGLSMG